MPVVPVKTYYLAISTPNLFDLPPKEGVSIKNWSPSTEEYLNIYRDVGNQWGWTGRTTISQKELNIILKSNKIKLYLIYYKNEIAGFSELDIKDDEVELKYFGLLEHYVGKGIGGYALKWSINKAWEFTNNTVTVHTCEFDHPSALSIYQKVGFNLIKEQIDNEFYTDEFLNNRD